MSKPVIGIVVWRRGLETPLGDPEMLHTLADAYVTAVSDAGLVPILIPNAQPVDDAPAFLDRIDGLIVSGGGDVDPGTYGDEDHGSYDTDAMVDGWELALLGEARRRKTPTLGICRGSQILNVAFGGTLKQHVLSDGAVHETLKGRTRAEMLAFSHPVSLAEGGRLAAIYGTTDINVNTLHHQGIGVLGDGLVEEGRAPDGLIEAVAAKDPNWWCVGVQWHPERNHGKDAVLFAALAAAVAR